MKEHQNYTIRFACSNCKHEQRRSIKCGKKAPGRTKCRLCGCQTPVHVLGDREDCDADGQAIVDWQGACQCEADPKAMEEVVRRANAYDEIISALQYAMGYVTNRDADAYLQRVVIKWGNEDNDQGSSWPSCDPD